MTHVHLRRVHAITGATARARRYCGYQVISHHGQRQLPFFYSFLERSANAPALCFPIVSTCRRGVPRAASRPARRCSTRRQSESFLNGFTRVRFTFVSRVKRYRIPLEMSSDDDDPVAFYERNTDTGIDHFSR